MENGRRSIEHRHRVWLGVCAATRPRRPRKLGLSAAPRASMLGACCASLEDAREPRDPTSHPTPATGLVVDERTRVVGTTIRGTPAAAASRRLPDARLDERGG